MGLEPRQPVSLVCVLNPQLCCLSKTFLVIKFFLNQSWPLAVTTPVSFTWWFIKLFSDKPSCPLIIFSSPGWQSLVLPAISHVALFPCSRFFLWLHANFGQPGKEHLRFKVRHTCAGISASLLISCIYLSRYFIGLLSRGSSIRERGLIVNSLIHCWNYVATMATIFIPPKLIWGLTQSQSKHKQANLKKLTS